MSEQKPPLRIGVAGLGTVGAGVVNMLKGNADLYYARTGRQIVVSAASVQDWSKPRACDISGFRKLSDPMELAQADDVDVVVETMGGSEGAAYLLCKAALENGKSVVTANKALLALKGEELFPLAERNQAALYFEAAVAGGIPIIKTVRESLAGNRIKAAYGILNGTSNYILSSMETTGAGFDEALKEAQDLGYAEADPHFDVDGIDAAHKTALLSCLCFGELPQFHQIHIEGIRRISDADMQACKKLNGAIRLLGVARQHQDGTVTRSVYPAFLAKTHPLTTIHGGNNAIYIEAEEAGSLFLTGAGAGMYPTASAVTGDIIDIARGLHSPALSVSCALCKEHPAQALENRTGAHYFRLEAENKAGVLAGVTSAFAKHNVSLDRIEQYLGASDKKTATICGVTGETGQRNFSLALAAVSQAPGVLPGSSNLRAEGF